MAAKPIREWPVLNWWMFRPIFWIYDVTARLFLPFMTVWRHERPMLWLFCSVNILVAQISILASFWMALEREIDFQRVLQQNMLNASFYVFSVSLLVTTASILVAEYLEIDGKDKKIELRGHKVSWGIVAALLVLFQVTFTGNLISDSLRSEASSTTAVATVDKQKTDAAVAGRPDQKVQKPTASTTNNGGLLKILKTFAVSNQLLLWLVSMFVAVHIFCLTRMHAYPEELHKLRNRQLDVAKEKAAHLHITSDAVKV